MSMCREMYNPRISYRTISLKFNDNSTIVGFLVRARPVDWKNTIRSSKLVTRSRSLLNSSSYSKQERLYISVSIDWPFFFTVAPIFYYPLDIVPRRDNRVFYNVREDQLSFFQSLPSLFPFRVNRIYIYIYIYFKGASNTVDTSPRKSHSTVARMRRSSRFFFFAKFLQSNKIAHDPKRS